jgi:hypothetical protein
MKAASSPLRACPAATAGAWERKHIEAGIEAMIRKVRDDPGAARKLLEKYTAGCRTVGGFYRERQFPVFGACIPAVLLDHCELSRTGLRL